MRAHIKGHKLYNDAIKYTVIGEVIKGEKYKKKLMIYRVVICSVVFCSAQEMQMLTNACRESLLL